MVKNIELANSEEIDMYEWWYLTHPFDQYRAIMQATAENYMRVDEGDREENLDKAIYVLKRLKEKESKHKGSQGREPIYNPLRGLSTHLEESKEKPQVPLSQECRKEYLEYLYNEGYQYLSRDVNKLIYAYKQEPHKGKVTWGICDGYTLVGKEHDFFPEVVWENDEPTKIDDLLADYDNIK